MAEITNKKTDRSTPSEAIQVETGSIDAEDPEGFSADEVARMVGVKQAIAKGRYSDLTTEYKKLLFVEWLIEHEKLKS